MNKIDDLVYRFLDLEVFIEDLIQENKKLRSLNNLNITDYNDDKRKNIDYDINEKNYKLYNQASRK